MNVLHGPTNFGSQASGLANAENAIRKSKGIEGLSYSVNFSPSKLVSNSNRVFHYNNNSIIANVLSRLHSFAYLVTNLRKFDVYHLYFGLTYLRLGWRVPIIGQLEIRFLKSIGKRVFMTYQGCDCRLRKLAQNNEHSPCVANGCDVPWCGEKADKLRRRSSFMLSKYIDRSFVLNPDLLANAPNSEFLPYCNIDTTLKEANTYRTNVPPIVVHGPTNRAIKGTEFVLHASKKLMNSHPHKLLLLAGIPRHELIENLSTADILIDQLRLGWYGGLAVEGMSAGIPVVAYLEDRQLERIPSKMRDEMPIASATPDTLGSVLADLLQDAPKRLELSEASRKFAHRWHNPLAIAEAMLTLYAEPMASFWEQYSLRD